MSTRYRTGRDGRTIFDEDRAIAVVVGEISDSAKIVRALNERDGVPAIEQPGAFFGADHAPEHQHGNGCEWPRTACSGHAAIAVGGTGTPHSGHYGVPVPHLHEDDDSPCYKIECHELGSGEYCTWCDGPCRVRPVQHKGHYGTAPHPTCIETTGAVEISQGRRSWMCGQDCPPMTDDGAPVADRVQQIIDNGPYRAGDQFAIGTAADMNVIRTALLAGKTLRDRCAALVMEWYKHGDCPGAADELQEVLRGV